MHRNVYVDKTELPKLTVISISRSDGFIIQDLTGYMLLEVNGIAYITGLCEKPRLIGVRRLTPRTHKYWKGVLLRS